LNHDDKVICWGTGKPLREFLYVEDFAEACLYSLENWEIINKNSPKDANGNLLYWLNVGSGFEISIKKLSIQIAKTIGFRGEIVWDNSKPDGTPRKKLDTTHLNNLGWYATTNLVTGISKTIESFKEELNTNIIRL